MHASVFSWKNNPIRLRTDALKDLNKDKSRAKVMADLKLEVSS